MHRDKSFDGVIEIKQDFGIILVVINPTILGLKHIKHPGGIINKNNLDFIVDILLEVGLISIDGSIGKILLKKHGHLPERLHNPIDLGRSQAALHNLMPAQQQLPDGDVLLVIVGLEYYVED